MRKITADYVFSVSSPPIKNGIVLVDDFGVIIDCLSNSAFSKEENTDLETYSGIITPGFVNSHCHLELSFLKNEIEKKTGLDGFIAALSKKIKQFSDSQKMEAMHHAESEMITQGIVAVGDISNTSLSKEVKLKRRLMYHTFIELFGFHPDVADKVFAKGMALSNEFTNDGLLNSISPHAPYSISDNLLHLINIQSGKGKSLVSIHFAENEDEYEFFMKGTGKISERLSSFGIDSSFWKAPGESPVKWMLERITAADKILFVHNTVLLDSDLIWLQRYAKEHQTEMAFCFCPSANIYIENKLPDFNRFMENGFLLTVGTDSLASNETLSVLDEIKIIAEAAPQIPLPELIKWATLNGASFFGFEKQIGSIEKGKMPGLNLISNVDIEKMKLTKNSFVKKLI